MKKAFTLSEVLITLVIIGVIAAITVPVLNQNTNKQETITKLKKAFSTLSQATDRIIMEEGPSTEWATSTDKIYNLYKNKLNILKDCGSEAGCWTQGTIKYLNNDSPISWVETLNGYRKFILSDGTQVLFDNLLYSGCTGISDADKTLHGSDNFCGKIWVDINGAKSPNTIGKDVFVFALKENGLYPMGCDIENACDKTKRGWACTCQALMDGNLDY